MRPRPPGKPDAWTEETTQQGRTGSQRLRDVTEVMPSPAVAHALKSPAGERVVVRQRIMLLDEQPVELTDSYYPISIARGTRLAEPRKIPGGAITLLTELGYPPQHVHEDISARVPTTEELQTLKLPEDVPVIRQFRVIYSDEHRPVEASVLIKGAHLYELSYHETIR